MKSPNISTIVIAAIFAIIAFFVFSSITATPVVIAVFVFVSIFVALIVNIGSDNPQASSPTDHPTADIKTLYVGNLPYRANETTVRELFSTYGSVESVRLMKDKHTGKRRGFGFVEMSADGIDKAIESLNDAEFKERTLKVREAKERPERSDTSE
ncbi:RNA-binding protein [Colwellia sp. MSW7]|uniref:RNA-binding protein n=1 Tax=Colwellia maritima TaxID=2912588 RepID=A0ABS9WY74_9GAMM|nr:RNA-binding protein [Colwellia maritima]MCI2282880.1 RNA-binding protein [Colwellia maritima]